MKKRVGILQFPGTNCDRDIKQAVEEAKGQAIYVWHRDRIDITQYDAFILPGGFSYGDYLRAGVLASMSPVMEDIRSAAGKGYPIMGICNGFQILCETELLPGALLRNQGLRFIDEWVSLKMHQPHEFFGGQRIASEEVIQMPIAHAEGRYYIDHNGLEKLQDNEQVWLSYLENPNGSVADIAGVKSEKGNVCGMMPHPERALFEWMGGSEGLMVFL